MFFIYRHCPYEPKFRRNEVDQMLAIKVVTPISDMVSPI